MRPYETVMIFDPEVEESQVQEVLDRALEVVRASGGTPGTVDRWGRRTLAYEMNHKREGYYVVAEFTAEPAVAAELDRVLALADPVMRHKIIRLPERPAGAPPRTPSTARAAPAGGPRSGPGARGPGGSRPAGPTRTGSGTRASGSTTAARDSAPSS